MKRGHLNIDPAIRDDGRVDFVLFDSDTKETVYRGEWKEVNDKANEILKREKEEA